MQSCKWLHSYVFFFHLSPQIICPKRCKVALVAFVRFFTKGSFQMFSRIACLNRWKVAFIAFERLFTWGSFQMFSQIACMNRCKVTNGCICTFFSTVSSNCLPEQMQSHIDCICMLFSRVSFQMCPQIACLYRCKVALVAFVQLFSVDLCNIAA